MTPGYGVVSRERSERFGPTTPAGPKRSLRSRLTRDRTAGTPAQSWRTATATVLALPTLAAIAGSGCAASDPGVAGGGPDSDATRPREVATSDAAPSPARHSVDGRPGIQHTDLGRAIREGDVDRVRALLDADPSLAGRRYDMDVTPLYVAAGAGQVEMVDLLLDRGADADARRRGDATPLKAAVERGAFLVRRETLAAIRGEVASPPPGPPTDFPAVVRRLLEAGADPSIASDTGERPLQSAAQSGAVDLVRALLDGGADPNARDRAGMTALHGAVARSGLARERRAALAGAAGPDDDGVGVGVGGEVVDLLLAAGADPSIRDDAGGTPADYAVAVAVEGAIRADAAARLDAILARHPERVGGLSGRPPLMVAIVDGVPACATVLIARGADVNASRSGTPMLHLAAEFGRPEIARRLLDAGADADARDAQGRTALAVASDYAAARRAGQTGRMGSGPPPDAEGVKRVLLAAGRGDRSDPNARDDQGRTLAFAPDVAVARAAVRRGADVDAVDRYGYTPLRAAAVDGQGRLARALLDLGAALDVTSAAALGDERAVRRRLAADPSLVDFRFENTDENRLDITPLVAALKNDRAGAARVLIDAGADVNAGFAGWGMTPLQLATANDDAATVGLLLSRGARADVTDAGEQTPLDDARSPAVARLLRSATRSLR